MRLSIATYSGLYLSCLIVKVECSDSSPTPSCYCLPTPHHLNFTWALLSCAKAFSLTSFDCPISISPPPADPIPQHSTWILWGDAGPQISDIQDSGHRKYGCSGPGGSGSTPNHNIQFHVCLFPCLWPGPPPRELNIMVCSASISLI